MEKCRTQPVNAQPHTVKPPKICPNAAAICFISTISSSYILEVKNKCEKPLKLKREFGEIMWSIERREYECKIC